MAVVVAIPSLLVVLQFKNHTHSHLEIALSSWFPDIGQLSRDETSPALSTVTCDYINMHAIHYV